MVKSQARRVNYYVHGRGRGHGSRAKAVVCGLERAGCDVRLHAGGQALDLLDPVLPRCDFRYRDPLLPGPFAPVQLAARTVADRHSLLVDDIDLVVSDGDQAAILAARSAGVPCIVVGHDLVFHPGISLPELPAGPLAYQRLNSLPALAGDRFIAVHFLPAVSRDARFRVARPDGLRRPLEAANAGHIVFYSRDNVGANIATYLGARGHDVRWFGGRGPVGRGVQCIPFSHDAFRCAVASSAAVVSSAGSNVLGECIALGKPVLALYRSSDREQQLNATLAAAAGVALASSFEQAVPFHVRSFLARLETRDFACVDLLNALPPLTTVVFETVQELLDSRHHRAPLRSSSSAYNLSAT